MSRFGILHTQVGSGDVLSDVIEVQGAKSIGLLVSISNSCVGYLKGSFDVSSANARRISKVDGSADWSWNVGSGMKAIDLKDVALAFPYLRFETSVIQSNASSLSAVCKY
mgnify:FL=1